MKATRHAPTSAKRHHPSQRRYCRRLLRANQVMEMSQATPIPDGDEPGRLFRPLGRPSRRAHLVICLGYSPLLLSPGLSRVRCSNPVGSVASSKLNCEYIADCQNTGARGGRRGGAFSFLQLSPFSFAPLRVRPFIIPPRTGEARSISRSLAVRARPHPVLIYFILVFE